MPLYPPGSSTTLSDATPANVQPGVPDAGVATEVSRDDHAHDASWSGVAPSASAPGDAAATGAAQGFNRRDHVHGREAVASQAEMEAGTEAAVRAVSPLRVKQAIDALGGAAAHIADATDAHDASAISFDDTGLTITAADVQTMGEQLDAAISAGGIPATIFDAKGDIIVASAADTAARMAAGADFTVPRWRAAATNGLEAVFPPGYELDYVEFTSPVSVTATTEGTANTVVSGSAVAYDGSTVVLIEAYMPLCNPNSTVSLVFILADGGTAIGELSTINVSSGGIFVSQSFARKLTPSAATHTYSIEAYTGSGTANVYAGAGGAGNKMPGFIRITKA